MSFWVAVSIFERVYKGFLERRVGTKMLFQEMRFFSEQKKCRSQKIVYTLGSRHLFDRQPKSEEGGFLTTNTNKTTIFWWSVFPSPIQDVATRL